MKLGHFEKEGRAFYGIVEGDDVLELEGSPFAGGRRTDRRHALAGLKLLVPCTPGNFYCAGLNYAAHVEWANKRSGGNMKLPQKADIGYRSPSALIASGETIVIPADSTGPVQFEGELVAVIGQKARNLSESEALSCVLGYTLGNDLSERSWQSRTARCGARRMRHMEADGTVHRIGARSAEADRLRSCERPESIRVRHGQDALHGAAFHRAHHAIHDTSPG